MAVGPGEIVLLIAVGLILYGDSIRLPFFFDDPLDLRWVEQSSLVELWTGAAGVGYYRPLPFTVW